METFNGRPVLDTPFADVLQRAGLVRLPDGMRLEDAPFWSPAQSQLLREERHDDADWAMVVDRLNVALHAMPG